MSKTPKPTDLCIAEERIGMRKAVTPPSPNKPHCCHIGCQKQAKWQIWHGDTPDDYTESCTEHVGVMLTDAQEHRVYPCEKPCCDSPRKDKCDQCQETGLASPLNQS